jgi:hypothetical protein
VALDDNAFSVLRGPLLICTVDYFVADLVYPLQFSP